MAQIEHYSINAVRSLAKFSISRADEAEAESMEADDNVDILGLSDDEFEKLNPAALEQTGSSDENDMEPEENDEDEKDESDEPLGDDQADEESEDDANAAEEDPAAEGDSEEQAEASGDASTDQPNEGTEQPTIDYKVVAEAALSPLKASGKTVKVRDIDHLRALAQMGIDYNKKLHELKPHRQALKTLEKTGILGNEEELNLLIEARNGNPEAIKRLIAQAKIDPLDLADEESIAQAATYRPQNHLVNEQEIEIEDILRSIQGSEAYDRTIDVITKEFDEKSRAEISENPHYIRALNADIENGVYDQVMEVIQYQKDMGQVPPNMSDMQLYIQTIQQLAAQEQQQPAQQQPQQMQQQEPAKKPTSNNTRRKQAMSGSRKSKKKSGSRAGYNPLEMSDEEFMKLPDLPAELRSN